MSSVTMGFVGLGAILALVGLRMPIAVALALVGVVGIAQITSWSTTFSFMESVPYDFSASWELSAAPMFLLMGSIIYRSGLTESMYQAMRLWLGGLPGGLAVATNMAAAVFAAACGSSIATTIAIGRFAIPEMLKSNYDKGLATAVCACAGTLGSMIPPSITMILYCAFTGQSVAAMFAAGVVPGVLTAVVYAVMIITRAKLNPALAPRIDINATLREKWAIVPRVWPMPVLIVIVIGSIYGGVATPTEAGAFGAFGALVLAILTRRFSVRMLREGIFEALQATATIFFVAIGAVFITRFLALSGVPDVVTAVIQDMGVGPVGLILIAAVMFLVLGCFMESVGLMLLSLPILIPAFESLGVNLIWFGIIMVKLLEVGLMSPPVGLNVFAAKALVKDEVSLEEIFRGTGWFLACEAFVIVLLIAFPSISLWLPRTLGLM